MTEYQPVIEAMAAACDELRRVSGQPYASVELGVRTNTYAKDGTRTVAAEWGIYCAATGSLSGETLAQVLELALRACAPAQLIERAKELRKEADLLEAKAREEVPA